MVIERARKVNKRIEQIGLGDNKRFENLFVEDSVKRAFKEVILSGDVTKLKSHKEELKDVISNLLPENLTDAQTRDYVISSLLEMGQMFVEPKFPGVNSRILFNYILNNMEEEAKRENKEMYVIYLDAVGLGKMNEKYGDIGGDVMLQTIIESVKLKFEGSKFEIVRLGGDEFGIAVSASNKDEAEYMIQEALTNARENNLVEKIKKAKQEMNKDEVVDNAYEEFNENSPSRDKADFRYGISKYDPQKQRESIDEAKKGISDEKAEKYQQTVNTSEDKAEKKEKSQRNLEKEARKKKSIEKFIEIFSNTMSENKDITFETIRQQEPDKSKKCQAVGNKVGVDFLNSYLTIVKALYSEKKLERYDIDKVKEELEKLYNWDVEDLLDNFLEFSQFFRVGSKDSAQAHSQDDFLDIIKDNKNLKAKVIEFSNLKLINSARGHEGGNRYIKDVFDIIESALANAEDKGVQNYYLRKSGNAIILFYDERNENVFQDIIERANNYQMEGSTLALNLYMVDIEATSDSELLNQRYEKALDNISEQKAEERTNTIQIMKTNKGIELYYDRSLFTLDELKQVLFQDSSKATELQGLIENLDEIERMTKLENEVFSLPIEKVQAEARSIREDIEILIEKVFEIKKQAAEEMVSYWDEKISQLTVIDSEIGNLESINFANGVTDEDRKALLNILENQVSKVSEIKEMVNVIQEQGMEQGENTEAISLVDDE